MKRTGIFIGIVFIIGLFFQSCIRQDDFPVLTGPYLGQTPPGTVPELFGPGIISTGLHDYCSVFSPDGREFYFGLGSGPDYVIVCTRVENRNWAKPEICPFTGKYNDSEPSMSYDGKKIAFRSNRPLSGEGKPKNDSDIWIVERTGSTWNKPRRLPPPINSDASDFYPTFSRMGDLYFTSDRDGGCEIYVSRFKNGQYAEPEKLSTAINSKFDDWDACISPDESYIIFGSYNRPDGYGRGDLYISYRNEDDSWSEAVNMGEKVNSSEMDIAPWISYTGNIIFFSSGKRIQPSYSERAITYDEKIAILNSPGNGNTDIYWVDAKIVEELRPRKPEQ